MRSEVGRWMLVAAGLVGACSPLDALCDSPGCQFSTSEWARISALANPPAPPPDATNRFSDDAAAIRLGHQLFFDRRLSGRSLMVDQLGREVFLSRAPKGEAIEISCATCHDPRRGGTESLATTSHLTVGAGIYNLDTLSILNLAYTPLLFWNGRVDSLFWQVFQSLESPLTMNGNRIAIVRLLADHYARDYDAVFGEDPLPAFTRSASEAAAFLAADGRCPGEIGACPPGCAPGIGACWPRWPLAGKPGLEPGCDRSDPNEPFGDAFDCMDPRDRAVVDQATVNLSKAMAAYERALVATDSDFDRFVAAGPDSNEIGDPAKRGARLFVSKASCVDCHRGPMLSDRGFHNIGVPDRASHSVRVQDCLEGDPRCDCVTPANCLPFGWFDGLTKLQTFTKLRSDGALSDGVNPRAEAFFGLEPAPSFKGAWRTPSLRGVSNTAPYFHTGVAATLEAVVRHYNRGGTREGAAPEHRSLRMRPLGLSEDEILDLVAFLQSLEPDALPAALAAPPPIPGIP